MVVLLTALPCHFYLAAESLEAPALFGEAVRLRAWLHWWLIAGIGGSVLLGAIATAVPLWIGFRAFRRWEF